ncbi:glycine cleavage system aminomethyltransferase GcvT [Clostridium sp. P21]|uniref:aminomethyltransferase n=1 Tax=Clostridium muellerianum TaxID=2716538 RepID=A0A7Y0EEH0_9CLOT|nr:glycine cleavage system aminomethyltransferase GcvT [Clostridium muellerianum]NMM62004.1 glycine cleavage system aminomethyltransferase GcvT [Clostridium muellerianum]
MEALKKNPLYNVYEQYGGKIGKVAGWALPMQFEGIAEEYKAIRKKAGLFDVSHIGKIQIKGKDAFNFIQSLVTNDIKDLKDNMAMYTLMCYPYGAVIEIILLYKLNENDYLITIKSGNVKKIFKWLINKKKKHEVSIINISSEVSQLELQGPKSEIILQGLTDVDLKEIKYLGFRRNVNVCGVRCLISRTGYTGEDGFEIYTSPNDLKLLWNSILEAGTQEGIKPVGSCVRDALRLDANLPPFGDELLEDVTPFEAGLKTYVNLRKSDFIGKNALQKENERGIKRKIVKFETGDKCNSEISGSNVIFNGKKIGVVAAEQFSPKKKKNMGLALVDSKYSKRGTIIFIKNMNDLVEAKVTK